MIQLVDVERQYRGKTGPIYVLRGINAEIRRGESLAIIGANGAGKTTLLKMIARAEPPSYGHVYSDVRVSWPIALTSAFTSGLTARENIRFVARIYGAEIDEVEDFVAYFSELGRALKEPIKGFSNGMKQRLAFSLSMAIDFDTYLIDESLAVGDAAFQRKCKAIFEERRARSDVIMTSHSVDMLRDYCTRAGVLYRGELHLYDSVDEANEFYKELEQ